MIALPPRNRAIRWAHTLTEGAWEIGRASWGGASWAQSQPPVPPCSTRGLIVVCAFLMGSHWAEEHMRPRSHGSQYFLSIYLVPGTALDTGHKAANKA